MTKSVPISARAHSIVPSITLAVTAKAAQLKAEGVDIISFGAGQPDFGTPAHIREAAKRALDSNPNVSKYTNVRGVPELREAVAATMSTAHDMTLSANQVLVSCGAKHSIFNIFMATLDPGDEVIIPAPYWVSYPDMVTVAGGTPVVVPTTADEGFLLEPEALREAITDRTRILLLNSPSNPTGSLYDRARLEVIASIVMEHNLFVISDDIYRLLVYGDACYTSFASLAPQVAERTILVDGVSKTYAMTGWRIGFTAGPIELIESMAKIQGQSTSNAAHVSQVAALAALTGPQDCVDEMRVTFDKRRREMLGLLAKIPHVTCAEPFGAFYAFPDLSAYVGKKTPDGQVIADDVALCDHLLGVGKIAIVPGSGFGAPGCARLSYACSMDDIRRGLARLAETLGSLV
ncbi:MAG: pyridoxal phosphate-dependent aminotransferase [Proteobacteria bacterium]|nr:pyridoxal phosphate-dependent aminotransferase [Pseudomonadota bacterium]